jgi:L-alanine-DL-glutamate epimerase-like enolase superfamily enzyme
MNPLTRNQFLKTLGFGALASTLTAKLSFASPKMEEARAGAKSMKIKDVEIYYNDIKLVEPFTISLGTIYSTNGVLIRILTDSGITGIGESSPFQPITGETQQTNIDVARSLREMFKGKDPLAIESANKLIGTFVHTNPSIVAAFDMALYDILGKVAGLPVFRLLGGDKATFEMDITTGIDTPEKMVKSVKANIAAGYKTLKIKIGQDPDKDVARLQAIRDAIGYDYPLRIDANQGYSVPQAVYALRQMEKLRIQYCEQPVVLTDIDGMRQVREGSPIPIMADEALFSPTDAIRLIKADACDYFNIKLMKAGGISNSLKISIIAEAANINCMVGCMMETNIGLTAAAHVVAARKNIIFADLDGNSGHAVNPVIGGMTVRNGTVTLPEKPGLGVDIDPAFLKTLKKA